MRWDFPLWFPKISGVSPLGWPTALVEPPRSLGASRKIQPQNPQKILLIPRIPWCQGLQSGELSLKKHIFGDPAKTMIGHGRSTLPRLKNWFRAVFQPFQVKKQTSAMENCQAIPFYIANLRYPPTKKRTAGAVGKSPPDSGNHPSGFPFLMHHGNHGNKLPGGVLFFFGPPYFCFKTST